jgi:hypothetical protein
VRADVDELRAHAGTRAQVTDARLSPLEDGVRDATRAAEAAGRDARAAADAAAGTREDAGARFAQLSALVARVRGSAERAEEGLAKLEQRHDADAAALAADLAALGAWGDCCEKKKIGFFFCVCVCLFV